MKCFSDILQLGIHQQISTAGF